MADNQPTFYDDVEKCADDIIRIMGKRVNFAMPLALGKSYHLTNELYRRAKEDPEIQLTFVTALALEKPTWSSDLEKRLVKPMRERIWKGVPDFDYVLDMRKNALPKNVVVTEFFFKAGSYNNVPMAQQNHSSSNYTHAIRDITNCFDTLVACQCVCKGEIDGETVYSNSCNSDLAYEIYPSKLEAERMGKKVIYIGHVNDTLPFMYGDAVEPEHHFDMILDSPKYCFPLFSAPKAPVCTKDYMIGLHVSSLIKDGGTLQIGIGTLGDAIASGLLMRHHNNGDYNQLLDDLGINNRYSRLIDKIGGRDEFAQGLYGATEMLVDVFIELYTGGIIKRNVYHNIPLMRMINDGALQEEFTPESVKELLLQDEHFPILKEQDFISLRNYGIFKDDLRYEDYHLVNGAGKYSVDFRDSANLDAVLENCLGDRLKNGVVLTGSFFIGPNGFYDFLRDMSDEERKKFEMTGVKVVNQLYGDEVLRSLERKDARFVNAGMKISLMGNVASDALRNGTVISGVGGQYNFVSMAHALPDARLIMMLRSTKETPKEVKSNILFNYGYTTIPRHLRDIVVTEYGIADLRSKQDWVVMTELIKVADSRFQDELLDEAKKAGKVPMDYEIPYEYRNNYPDQLEKKLAPFKAKGYFKPFPFGKEFTDEEVALGASLRKFKGGMTANKFKASKALIKDFKAPVPPEATPYLKRMNLDAPKGVKEKLMQKLVVHALSNAGYVKLQ
ncbi:acetyl-CoA hydrolase/transferase C-terminal domain-containing protein [Desulfatibacillum aliphaticivorans]|uniref:Acetyl-CoA hydrolase/transferase C-terminal domain-containing protein n=1 Tax=Desulfatibacillum aliphaticivorans TaxID=218208 RepID=B8FMI7_DESAL|nr:acetyl-CoA hydrolase/transferase C-terminal domain-containing protein [Desulfatibacillum aliphaticivorans]ACL01854.1 conserved hypothetical protein [Desulfatibacillum aliphaticivorans]